MRFDFSVLPPKVSDVRSVPSHIAVIFERGGLTGVAEVRLRQLLLAATRAGPVALHITDSGEIARRVATIAERSGVKQIVVHLTTHREMEIKVLGANASWDAIMPGEVTYQRVSPPVAYRDAWRVMVDASESVFVIRRASQYLRHGKDLSSIRSYAMGALAAGGVVDIDP